MDGAGSFPRTGSRARPRSALAARNTRSSRSLEGVRCFKTTGPRDGSTIADRTLGGMSEWLKEMRCKRIGSAYAGSNPAPPIPLACLLAARLIQASRWLMVRGDARIEEGLWRSGLGDRRHHRLRCRLRLERKYEFQVEGGRSRYRAGGVEARWHLRANGNSSRPRPDGCEE